MRTPPAAPDEAQAPHGAPIHMHIAVRTCIAAFFQGTRMLTGVVRQDGHDWSIDTTPGDTTQLSGVQTKAARCAAGRWTGGGGVITRVALAMITRVALATRTQGPTFEGVRPPSIPPDANGA